MSIKYVAFDIEIAKVLPDNENNWEQYRPLGISCAALATSDTKELTTWYDEGNFEAGGDFYIVPLKCPNLIVRSSLSPSQNMPVMAIKFSHGMVSVSTLTS